MADEPVIPSIGSYPQHKNPRTNKPCPYMADLFCNKCGWVADAETITGRSKPGIVNGGHFKSTAVPEAAYKDFLPTRDVNFYSWSPAPPGEPGPLTEVHVHLGMPPGIVFRVKLKSADVCDEWIDALIKHREDVWGPRKK